MNILSVRRSLASGLLAAAAAFLVASCGGGGSSPSTGDNGGGFPSITPDGATFYAGVPNTLHINNGFAPFKLNSSEPSLLSVPASTNNRSIDVVPANPGVIDANLPPGSLPVRTVNITLTDAQGRTAAASIKVGRNYLTGYGASFSSNCPAPSSGSTGAPACAGGETLITLVPITNGDLYGNRQVRFEVIRGPFSFISGLGGTVIGNTYTTTTDHSGAAIAIVRVNQGAAGQFAVVRVTDVATGVYVDEVFPISTTGPTSTLSAVPGTFTFTGPLTGICGTGTGQFVVFGGQAPFTALSSDPNVTVTPTSTGANPPVFTVSAQNPNVCVSGATIIVTDALGSRVTVTVTTQQGTAQPPQPTPITVAPSTITLACGTSGSVSVVGGTGSYTVNSTHPRVTAVASSNTVTITRVKGDAGGVFPTTGDVSITDGFSTATVTFTVPANCP